MPPATRATSIAKLTAMMDAVQTDGRLGRSAGNRGSTAKPVETGWGEVTRQAAHEWLAEAPPLGLMIDLVRRAIDGRERADEETTSPATQNTTSEGGAIFWMGRACWPYPQVLAQSSRAQAASSLEGMLGRSVFVDLPADRAVRVWAIDLVLRSKATVAVIADGRGIDMAQSRRLQLAAEAGRGLAMFWRKPEESSVLSAAHHRWLVSPVPTALPHPRWRIKRLRCKDAAAWNRQGLAGGMMTDMIVEQRGAQEGIVVVSADVADRPHATPTRPWPIIRAASAAQPKQSQRDRTQRRTA